MHKTNVERTEMSIFGSILQALGLQKPEAKPTATATTPAPTAPKPGVASPRPVAGAPGPTSAGYMGPSGPTPAATPAGMAAPASAPMAMVDVMSKLDNLAGKNPGLDWKVSIVDLMKLLNIDSSLSARKELAGELGCPNELIGGDYAKMNEWLHKTVLQKIAENGGNIPQSLLKK
jgi:Domain of unknown function (DUF3597)